MSELVIEVKNVSKSFRRGRREERRSIGKAIQETLMTPVRRVQSLMQTHLPTDAQEEFWALRDINFTVARGESLSIIGKNGSGKSTLLKLIAKVMQPTTGAIRTWGRIGTLLEVNAGFNPELTGRENVYLKAAYHGLTPQETDLIYDKIVDFAEIPDFMDTPFKRYSSGMSVRLGFAVSALIEPDILIVDEAFAVGDLGFREKCISQIQEYHRGGGTVLLVSHSPYYSERLSDRAIWLHEGLTVADGELHEVTSNYIMQVMTPYNKELAERLAKNPSAEIRDVGPASSPAPTAADDSPADDMINFDLVIDPDDAGKISIDHVKLLRHYESVSDTFNIEHPFMVEVTYTVHEAVSGQLVLRVHSMPQFAPVMHIGDAEREPLRREVRPPGRYQVRLTIPPYTLFMGRYVINAAFMHPASGKTYDFTKVQIFRVTQSKEAWDEWRPWYNESSQFHRKGNVGLYGDWTYLSDDPADLVVEPSDADEAQSIALSSGED